MTGESVWTRDAIASSDRSERDVELLLLFQKLSEGSVNALSGIYDLCSQQIYGLALWRTSSESDAADVLQEVFVRLAERRAALQKVRRPYPYILQMAHHAAQDIIRRRKREVSEECQLIIPRYDPSTSAPYVALLEKLIRELPAEQREAVYLRYFAGLSLQEIAKATSVTLFTAASRCRLGLAKLKRRMKHEG